MTIFMCNGCSDKPCYFDNNSTDDDVKPTRCPIEDYEHANWQKKKLCNYCESFSKFDPNSRYCGQCGGRLNNDLPPNICIYCGDFGKHCQDSCGIINH